jgi:hypothetical protein
MVVWTFRDIRLRTRDVLAQVLATLMVAVLTLPGLLVYLLLRPHTTLAEDYERSLTEEVILQDLEEHRICPSCQRRVEPDFVISQLPSSVCVCAAWVRRLLHLVGMLPLLRPLS